MVSVAGCKIEIVGARKESYKPNSRKPDAIPATLKDDVYRRDFTINTLLENLHTGELLDLTGKGLDDLKTGIIRTPLDPIATFDDDPLRMMRAVRFASRFGFSISDETLQGIKSRVNRLNIISYERIRDEFVKVIMCPCEKITSPTVHLDSGAVAGLELLRSTGLLEIFLPELNKLWGFANNCSSDHDLWSHSVLTMEYIPLEAGLSVRLAGLLHDIDRTVESSKTVDPALDPEQDILRKILHRMKFSNTETEGIIWLVGKLAYLEIHSCLLDDRAIRRLLRKAGTRFTDIFILARAHVAATGDFTMAANLDLLERKAITISQSEGSHYESPLDGREIMGLTGCSEGVVIGKLKQFLLCQVLDGALRPGDKDSARTILLDYWRSCKDDFSLKKCVCVADNTPNS
jgi:poly(A) polymerase